MPIAFRSDPKSLTASAVLRIATGVASAALGFHSLDHAFEFRDGQPARRVGRNALTLEFLRGLGDVGVNLGPQLPVTRAVAAKETEQARENDSQGGHDGSS